MSQLIYNTKTLRGFNNQAISSNTQVTGTVIDTKGFKDALVIVTMTARTDGTLTPRIYESDSSGSGFTDVADDYILGTEAGAAVSAAQALGDVGVALTKRYLRIDGVATGVTSGFTGGCIVVLGQPTHAPIA